MIKIYFTALTCGAKNASVEIHPRLRVCHRCVYTGSFELAYPRTLLAALHVHRIKILYRAFPERDGPRILSLESVDYFGTTDYFSGRKKKNNLNEQNIKVY